MLVAAALAIGCEGGGPAEVPDVPPELYRSKTTALHVEFEGVAQELREALLQRDLLERAAQVARILQKLGPESAEQVLEVYETVWMDLGQTELVLLAEWWARFDPHRAIEWAESDMRTAGTAVPRAVIRSWARHDPRAAITRANQGNLNGGGQSSAYRAAAIEGWEDSGQPGFVDYIRGLGPNPDRQRAIRGFARRKVMREGIDAAFQWADALSEDDKLFRLNILRRVATYAAKSDPVATANWVERYSGTYYMRSLPQRVAIQWAKNDPQATMKWLETLDTGRDQDEGVREAFRIWVSRDSGAAKAWLDQGEHQRFKDEAAAMVARRLQIGEPEKAIKVALRIVKDDLRIGTLIIIARTWGVQDERAAVDWVNNRSGLTEKEKELALTYGERWRQTVVTSVERRAKLDRPSAEARLEDMSDPDLEEEFSIQKALTTKAPESERVIKRPEGM